ncbi:NAD(P)/FAD-dependent oxidoreductase [Candidatus Poribacteria bacterium]|nr:NAD(P)/FAD-dependent oxidoreductase [Candidatus Poribacteria bacterium]
MDIKQDTSFLRYFRSPTRYSGLGPLYSGQTAVIIGGGPSGVGCAIALKNLAQLLNRNINVILYEGKQFQEARHYNQCVGVLSPPIDDILERQLKVPFPWHLVHRKINGYVMHSDTQKILLTGHDEPSYSVRRVTFDDYMLQQARQRGMKVVQGRVTDLEFTPHRVMIYSDSENISADVVVGAFGLDDGGCKLFERATKYKLPRFLDSIVTNIKPNEQFLLGFGNYIHAFLPSFRRIEFGAVTPKVDHLTINIAGADVTAADMDKFLTFPPVREILPPEFNPETTELTYFKGRFPISVAQGLFGDRYVVVGDAAGMVRPFKGKGVNSGFLTGIRAANTIMKVGISQKAFKVYYRSCSDVTDDLIYGKVLRWLAIKSANYKFIDSIIDLARRDDVVRTALFNCISAHKSFKEIYEETINFRTIRRGIGAIMMFPIRKHRLQVSEPYI